MSRDVSSAFSKSGVSATCRTSQLAKHGHGERNISTRTGQVPDVSTLRAAIPSHCFKPSLLRSMLYVVQDLIAIGSMVYTATWLIDMPNSSLTIPLWLIYGFVQGLFFTGIWILAHECGHGAFSQHQRINSIIGFVLHSIVLVPFFSWKYSHSRHHRYANHMDKDTVFVPRREEEHDEHESSRSSDIKHAAEDAPILSLLSLLAHQIFGWPMYIFMNAGAGNRSLVKSDRQATSNLKQSHLDPTSHIFTPSEHPYVLISDLGLFAVLACLYGATTYLGTFNVLLMYGMPYFWMNHWLVAITYLHHTHHKAAHYEDEAWTYQKGALSTVDREFGLIGKYLFHGIIEFHVVHHLFPRIPFYHAEEATLAIKPLLGDSYIHQDSQFLDDLWSTYTSCKYVKESDASTPGHMYWAKPS